MIRKTYKLNAGVAAAHTIGYVSTRGTSRALQELLLTTDPEFITNLIYKEVSKTT